WNLWSNVISTRSAPSAGSMGSSGWISSGLPLPARFGKRTVTSTSSSPSPTWGPPATPTGSWTSRKPLRPSSADPSTLSPNARSVPLPFAATWRPPVRPSMPNATTKRLL
ncbi:MAG: Nucleotidyltransferase domain protein, BT0168 group, partial [uncultured Thermomicrobiales bacterium]